MDAQLDMKPPPESPKAFIELAGLCRLFETKSDSIAALADVDLSIAKGERVALLGRSGSGKSTLLNLLAGLDRPTSGTISIEGLDISQFSSDRLAEYRRETVAMVFQAFHLIATKTATQNVELPSVFAGENRMERKATAIAALEAVGLKDRLTHRPSELSGGEQQRVAVARALVNKPSLLLADEPTGNLDSKTAADIIRYLVESSEAEQITVVMVTHDEQLANEFATRILRLHDGRLVE